MRRATDAANPQCLPALLGEPVQERIDDRDEELQVLQHVDVLIQLLVPLQIHVLHQREQVVR